METYLVYLSFFAAILIIGVLVSYIATKIKLPNLLFLILLGLYLGYSNYVNIEQILTKELIASLSIFALIMIVFDSSSKFKLKEIKQISPFTFKLAFFFLVACLTLFAISTQVLFAEKMFSIKSFLISLVFASLMAGTSPDVMLSAIKKTKNKIIELLQFESIINTPLTVLIPLVIMDFYFERLEAGVFLIKFLQQIMTGVGAGLLLGLGAVILLNKISSQEISPLLVIGFVLGIYSIAENISGNGILAVTTFGIVFGRSQIKNKVSLQKFEDIFTEFLTIIVFILVGMLISVPIVLSFIIKSIVLFFIYLVIRYIAVQSSFASSRLTTKEKLFMSLNVPKGLATVVVIFIFNTLNVKGIEIILHLSLTFILYSIILSTIITKFQDKFLILGETLSRMKKVSKKNVNT